MPVLLFERIPLPDLRVYVIISVGALAFSVSHFSEAMSGAVAELKRREFSAFLRRIDAEPVCFFSLINICYCALIVLARAIQSVVFGQLRLQEQQHLREQFWNFIFYKYVLL